MNYSEILCLEDANTSKIYLHREGDFLRAYEHSAYFFHRYVSDFKLSRRFIQVVNRYVISLSFPSATLKKWLYAYPCQEYTKDILVCDIEKPWNEIEYQNWTELARIEANPGDRYTVYTSIIEHQPVYKTAYDSLGHILDLCKNVEKNMREPYAGKAKNLSYEITYGVRILYDVSDRNKHIEVIQAKCKEILFVLQVLKDKRQISLDAFALASERIVSVSKQLEGLRRTATA